MKKQTVIVILLLIVVLACKSTQQQIKIDLTEVQKKEIISQLDEMGELDQKYRLIMGAGSLDKSLIDEYTKLMKAGDIKAVMTYMAKGYKIEKQQLDSLWQLQHTIDFDNYKKLKSIIQKYGYPSDKRLGIDKDMLAPLLVHPPIEIKPEIYLEEMRTLLLVEVKTKRMDAEDYAKFYDNIMHKILRKPQLYGMNGSFNPVTQSIDLPEIGNLEKTNKARAEIGLSALKEGEYKIGSKIKYDLTEVQKQELIKKLDEMGELDQKHRMITGAGSLDKSLISEYTKLMKEGDVKAVMAYMAKGYKLNKPQIDSIRKLQQVIDFDNYKKVISIIKEYGYPSRERLGIKQDKIAQFIIHPPKEMDPYVYLKEMGELLLSEVKAKRMDAETYANFYDNHKDKTLQEPQLYGTNKTINISTMSIGLPEIENIEKTNKARAEIGLSALKEGEYKIGSKIKYDLTETQKKEIIKEIDDILLLDQKYKTILALKNLDEAILKKDDELAKKGVLKDLVEFEKTVPVTMSQKQIDSIKGLQFKVKHRNIERAKTLIRKYGYPSRKRLGTSRGSQIMVILNSPPKGVVDKNIYIAEMSKLLMPEVKANRMTALTYAQIYDAIIVKLLKEPHLYGTYTRFNTETMSTEFVPIKSIEKTNKARVEIGLPSLNEGEYKLTSKVPIKDILSLKYHNYLKARNVSAVVLIKRNNQTHIVNLGETDNNSFNEHSVFNIGSATKTFTSVLILQQVQKGRMKLEDSISKYLNDIPNVDGTITIEELLRHESGLGELIGQNFLEIAFLTNDEESKESFLQKIPKPYKDKKHRYTNTNYLLLGHILEKVTNVSYYQLLQKNIFSVCGMNYSHPFLSKNNKNLVIPTHEGENILNSLNFKLYDTYSYSAGSVASTLSDMLLFYNTLYETNKLLNPQSFKLLTSSHHDDEASLKYCLGLMRIKHGEFEFYAHGGDNIGYSFRNYYDINNKNYLLILGNEVQFLLNYEIQTDALNYLKKIKIEQTTSIESSVVDALAGDYTSAKGEIDFSILNIKKLPFVKIYGTTQALLVNNDTLYSTLLDIKLTIDHANYNSLRIRMGKKNNVVYKDGFIPDSLKINSDFDVTMYKPYLGKYLIDAIGLEFELQVKKNKIFLFSNGGTIRLIETSKGILANTAIELELKFDFSAQNKLIFRQQDQEYIAIKQ